MKKLRLGIALLAVVPAIGFASDQGAYATVDVGAARYTNTQFPNPGKIGLGGGYKFNKNFAADIGLTIYGSSTLRFAGVGDQKLTAYSFYPSVVGIIPFTPKFSAFGKLGFSSNHAKSSGVFGEATASSTSPYLGLGLEYDIIPKLGFRAQYEYFGGFGTPAPEIKASAVSIGLIVYFK